VRDGRRLGGQVATAHAINANVVRRRRQLARVAAAEFDGRGWRVMVASGRANSVR
jgi:hypothetical protein